MKPPRLGRGLSALLGEPPAPPAAEAALRLVPIESLEPGPFQPRGTMADDGLQELADSIREHGLLQPILVRPKASQPGHYEIIGGERRWRAAQQVPLHNVPVVIRPLGDREAMAAGLVENLQRLDLNPLEEAEGYRRLIEEFGLTQEALGRAVGKSRSHIANTLRLMSLPPRALELLREGALTAGHARALLTAPDPEALAMQVVDRGLNVRQTEALSAARPREPAAPGASSTVVRDPDMVAVERQLSGLLGLKVHIRPGSGAGGELVVAFRTPDQLEGLIRLLGHH